MLGASGNSGNIVAQLLRGIAEAAGEAGTCDARALRAGLRRGAAEARAAVADPVEGTILTVAAAAADAVPDDAVTPAQVAGIALAAADEALGRTPEQLPALARAGVVDAGGQGLVLILEALVRSIGADIVPIAPVPSPESVPHQHSPGGGAFEVQYLLDTDAGRGAERGRHAAQRARRGSATPSWSSAPATARSRSTSTPTTPAPRSRPASPAAVRTGSRCRR